MITCDLAIKNFMCALSEFSAVTLKKGRWSANTRSRSIQPVEYQEHEQIDSNPRYDCWWTWLIMERDEHVHATRTLALCSSLAPAPNRALHRLSWGLQI